MELDEEESIDPTEKALELLSILSERLPTPSSAALGEPLPDWLLEPWASRLTELDDPNLSEAVEEAERWLQSH